MWELSSTGFLELWERGCRLHPLDQGLLAVSWTVPDSLEASPADWPLGRRNRVLLDLHCAYFGPHLRGWIACPQCGEKLEFQIDGRTLIRGAEDEWSSPGEPIVVKGHAFRVPTSRDLAHSARETESRSAAIRLLESCRTDEGDPLTWSDADMEEVGERMASADPLAETRLTMDCPNCGNQWEETLDTAAFVWAEIEARSKRLLREIHSLASAYGWSEKEILSLSESRRAFYLEMVEP